MASYTAPLREIDFVLNNVLKVGRLAETIPAFADATPEVFTEMVETLPSSAKRNSFP